MSIREMIKIKFDGVTKNAADSARISQEQLRNNIANGHSVLELKNGDYILVTSKTKIFVVRD